MHIGFVVIGIRIGWRSLKYFIILHVAPNSRLCLYPYPIANTYMPHNSDLPADHTVVTNFGRASYTCLGSDDRVLTDFNVVGNLYLIILIAVHIKLTAKYLQHWHILALLTIHSQMIEQKIT